tara:strand:- start:3449 stop:5314 length:1866 start_codon:yes stop_codon:yes gene_type:complete
MHENNNDKDETTLLENLFELKSHRLPKQNELKKLFKKYLNTCECEDEFYKNGVHLGNSRYGYCCNIKQNHWIWLAFFQGLQPKDLKMLLIKRNIKDRTMPIWQEILDQHQNNSNHVNKENINLKKDVDIFQKHIWLSDGVFLIMSSSQYASNCQYQTYCFSPGKTLPKNFINSLLLCATFTTELPLPIDKCLSSQGICSTQNCIHISYVGGRTEGSFFFDINNGYLHKYAKEKKILISSITVNLIDNNLKLHLLRYGFKIATIIDSKCYMIRIEYYSSKLSNLLTLFKSTISIEPMLNLLHTIDVVTTPTRNQNHVISKVGLISTQQFRRKINNNLVSGGISKLTQKQQQSYWSSEDEFETEVHSDNYLKQNNESLDESLFNDEDLLLNDESSGSSLLVEEVLRGVLTPLVTTENSYTTDTSLPYLPVIENNGKRNFANIVSVNYNDVPSKKYKKYKTNLVLVESILNILKSSKDDNTKVKELYQLCNTDKEYIILVGLIHSWANKHPNYDFVKQFVKNMFLINNENILKQIIRSEDVDIIYFMEVCSYLYEHDELKSIFNEIDLSVAKLIISEIIIFRSKQYFYNTTQFPNEYLLMKNNSKEELHPFLLDILSKQYKMFN